MLPNSILNDRRRPLVSQYVLLKHTSTTILRAAGARKTLHWRIKGSGGHTSSVFCGRLFSVGRRRWLAHPAGSHRRDSMARGSRSLPHCFGLIPMACVRMLKFVSPHCMTVDQASGQNLWRGGRAGDSSWRCTGCHVCSQGRRTGHLRHHRHRSLRLRRRLSRRGRPSSERRRSTLHHVNRHA